MAHKKAAGSAKNLRDSNPKYRGVKLFGGQRARAGNIIVRQKGNKYVPGVNVYAGKDYTLHATIDGIVSFRKKKMTRFDGRKYLKTIVDIVSETANESAPVKKTPAKVSTKAPTKKAAPAKKAEKAPAKPAKTETKAKAQAKKAPAKKAATPTTGGDDLSKLYGIAKKATEALHAGGITSFADLSSAKVGDIRSIVADAGAKLTADAKDIKKQATLAKNGKADELKALQAELKAAK